MVGVDATLINLCLKKDERALYKLYRHCYPMMKGIALRYVFDRERVGEVVNSGYLKIVQGLEKYDQNQPFRPWATTIMVRVALDYVRSVMRNFSRHVDLYEDISQVNGQNYASNDAELAFEADELLSMLFELPDQTRMVFNLFAIEGYSHKEISKMLDISDGTSKWHVSKARVLLQDKVKSKMTKKSSDYEPSH